MTASLLVLTLIGTAAIVWSACFIGCDRVFGLSQIAPFNVYQETVTDTPGLVAFWPLNDTSGTVAVELAPNHFDGTYTMGPVVTMYDAADQSDISPGTFTLNQTNIVAGDTVNGNVADPNPCVYFNGGFVSVPWQPSLGPAHFTLEAWVVPNWTLADAQTNPSNRVVVASADVASFAGFALLATAQNLWSIEIGIGSQFAIATIGSNHPIVQGSLYFLVVTYDGTTLSLWVNPADTSQPPDAAAIAINYAAVPSPVPLFIGTGRPDLPTPLFPFNGSIQDVALYRTALDGKTIEAHYLNGLGMQVS